MSNTRWAIPLRVVLGVTDRHPPASTRVAAWAEPVLVHNFTGNVGPFGLGQAPVGRHVASPYTSTLDKTSHDVLVESCSGIRKAPVSAS